MGWIAPWVSWPSCSRSVPGLCPAGRPFQSPLIFTVILGSTYYMDKETSLEYVSLMVTCFCLSHSKPHVFILYFLYSTLVDNRNLKNHSNSCSLALMQICQWFFLQLLLITLTASCLSFQGCFWAIEATSTHWTTSSKSCHQILCSCSKW